MSIPDLRTSRLILRPWTLEDARALFSILHEEDILQYFPNPAPLPLDKVQNYISHQLRHWQEHGYGHWAVTLREKDEVLGWCGLEYLPELNETEVAYLLSKNTWGKGFATEAARAALRFGFNNTGLEAIIGLVHPENRASIRVLEKCGLTLASRITLWGLEMCRYRIERTDHYIHVANSLGNLESFLGG